MKIQIPTEFKRLFDDDWREAAIYGGRGSLKSHTIARYLLIQARLAKKRVGCFREFQNSISESSYQLLVDLINKYELKEFKITDKTIENTINGSDFLFKGLHRNEQSIKSIEGIDIAWVEEAQTVSGKSIDVLTPTVRKPGSKIIYTYNRLEEEDAVHKRLVIEGRPNSLILNVNYDVAMKHGWFPEVLRIEMEDDKANRPALYKHKWLGEPNTQEGRIYKDWILIDEIPHEAKLVRYGLDFGYSIDPTVIVAIYQWNGGYIIDEIEYQKGLSNKSIADILNNREKAIVIADSAEPKSIDEIHLHGIPIQGAVKGPDSVRQGIQFVQEQRISLTRRSQRTYTAYLAYKWATDKDDKTLNIPDDTVHEWSNPMDAIRYGLDSFRPRKFNSKPRRTKRYSETGRLIS
jgi:phage terminase large subunit